MMQIHCKEEAGLVQKVTQSIINSLISQIDFFLKIIQDISEATVATITTLKTICIFVL